MGRKKKLLRLSVRMNNRPVGVLARAGNGAISFQYDTDWLEYENSMDISYSLPRRTDPYTGPEVYSYFENLLPDEQSVRKTIADRVGAESSEITDLFSAIGGDCVGALQFLPENTKLGTSIPDATGEELSERDIESILDSLDSTPLGVTKNKEFRISLAGAQEKTALLRMNGKWYLPSGPVPTTHILKKPLGKIYNGIDMSDSVENEWLCLLICKKLGLQTAKAEMARFGSIPCLIVERFDREWSDDKKKIYRLPTEDMCQALGISTSKKYQSEGGPGIVSIMKFLSASNKSQEDRESFIRAQIIFQLLGATDGHAKNFSIFLGPQGMNLTPVYDVLTVYPAFKRRQIEKKQIKLAMCVGESHKYHPHEIFKRHWEQTSQQSYFDKDFLEKILEDIKTKYENMKIEIDIPKGFSQEVLDSTLSNLKISIDRLYVS